MKRIFLFCIMAMLPFYIFAQHTISGKILSKESGDPLTGANVFLENTNFVVPAGAQGNFTIKNLKEGTYILSVSFLGYERVQQEVLVEGDMEITILLPENKVLMDEVVVSATRASERIPTTYTTMEREEIEERNLGQDIPFLLKYEPSVVVTSDAGAGVGYTGMRIRGSDQTRINVTINGIPLNDPESQGVFWVNMPDFASSVENIQIQRGLGTSTNGAGAFGATVNFQTLKLNSQPYGEINTSYGSFNTQKYNVQAGTGLIGEKFAFDMRLSKITSDGYIDRATSDLKSFFFSGGYHGKNNMLKAIIFSGKERTYQAWYGTPEEYLDTNRTWNYYTYENEVDDYQQDHYQLHYSHDFNNNLIANVALHYTYGRGFFEQFREDDDFADYGLAPVMLTADTIYSSDIVRRRWLDNHFYGATWSLNYRSGATFSAILGGGWNRYIGDHFGEIIWAQYAANHPKDFRYYDNEGTKSDLNIFTKLNYQFTDELGAFIDLQYRMVGYNVLGIDNDQRFLYENVEYSFFNPKAGVNYRLNSRNHFYAFFGIGNREPDRNDFIDAIPGLEPQPERMKNLEVGYRYQQPRMVISANVYLMSYKNQLVLTGELNDVGSPVRTNVDDSYRMGIELLTDVRITDNFSWFANATFSRNKISNFEEFVYIYGDDHFGDTVITYDQTDISFSPSIIAATGIEYEPLKGLKMMLQAKYVGQQYLDNTSSAERALDPYLISDFRISYTFSPKIFNEIQLSLLVNNIFSELYEANGYTFGWINAPTDEPMSREFYNYYYPQAPRNFLLALRMKI